MSFACFSAVNVKQKFLAKMIKSALIFDLAVCAEEEKRTLTLHTVFLHLLHLSDALSQITDEARAVLLTRSCEDDQDLTLASGDR